MLISVIRLEASTQREEVKAFVRNFEQKYNVGIPISSGYRTNSINHRKYGACDFNALNLTPKLQRLFINTLASQGFRVIDEIKATSKYRKSGRGIVHIDLRGVNKTNMRGTILVEENGYIYIKKQVKQVYQNRE